jgi:Ca-activated chloride channel homolog
MDFSNVIERLTPRRETTSADHGYIRKRVDQVVVFFTVTNGRRNVDDLLANEISITDEGKPPARISEFGHERSLPLRLGLLVDTSDSVRHRFKFERAAAKRFLGKTVRTGTDKAFVITFSRHSELMQDYSDDPERLARSISSSHFGDGTAIYDAVQSACKKLAQQDRNVVTAHVLVIISDGYDNSSQSTLTRAIEAAQRADVTIYTISTNDTHLPTTGDEILRRLAEETGGRAFLPSNPAELFSPVERDLRDRYVISYQPMDFIPDGRFRRIQIVAQRMSEKFRVHARSGYYASFSPQPR